MTVHITFAYANSQPGGGKRVTETLALLGFASASETLSGTSGTSTIAAGASSLSGGDPIARVYSDAAVKIAFGPTPTAATPWHYLPAGETRDYGVAPGDKIYFATA